MSRLRLRLRQAVAFLLAATPATLWAAEPGSPAKTICLHPRYVRLYTDPGVELAAANYQYKTLDWQVPVDEIALVCLDCWAWHFSGDTFEEMEKSVRQSIVPLLAAWRAKGMLVIHAPAGPVAQRHPNWVRLLEGKKSQAQWPDSPAWPPAEFRQKSGPYAKYARPAEPQHEERSTHAQTKRDFHPQIRPVGNEPVVLNGEELHRLCAQRKILHLVYVGFNTNACITLRDYGLPAMNLRGYTTILVRDGTMGMETAQTHKDMTCTRGAIADLEQFGSYTLAAREIIDALAEVGKPAAGSKGDGPIFAARKSGQSPSDALAGKPDAGSDPFVGDYAGTLHPLGTYAEKAKPADGKDFKPQKCGNCHVEAAIRRASVGYVLAMEIDRGKDKKGSPLIHRIELKADRQGEKLSFSNDKYAIAAEDGKLTGRRTGRMTATIELKRKAAPPTKAQ